MSSSATTPVEVEGGGADVIEAVEEQEEVEDGVAPVVL
jgi:hypothetical protein